MVHRLHHSQVLLDDAVQTPTTLFHISLDPANDPHIIIGINENLDIHQVTKTLVLQDQNPLNDKDILRLLAISLSTTRMRCIVICWNINRTSSQQLIDLLDHEVCIKGKRMVIVGLNPLFKG